MTTDLPKRIHITGGPGSGKSWLAHRLAKALGVDVIDLDGRGLQIKPLSVVITQPHKFEALIVAREADLDDATSGSTWVCEGAFVGEKRVQYERADLIVWMDAPWRVASYRIVARHVKAELRRRNRFPGWGSLYNFWFWSQRYYNDTNPPGLNVWGSPATRAYLRELLGAYEGKVLEVRTKRDVQALLRRFGA